MFGNSAGIDTRCMNDWHAQACGRVGINIIKTSPTAGNHFELWTSLHQRLVESPETTRYYGLNFVKRQIFVTGGRFRGKNYFVDLAKYFLRIRVDCFQ